jgi:hypothetical protein
MKSKQALDLLRFGDSDSAIVGDAGVPPELVLLQRTEEGQSDRPGEAIRDRERTQHTQLHFSHLLIQGYRDGLNLWGFFNASHQKLAETPIKI